MGTLFRPPGQIFAIFDFFSWLLGVPLVLVWIDKTRLDHPGHKKVLWGTNGGSPDWNYGEASIFAFCKDKKNGQLVGLVIFENLVKIGT